MDNIVDMSVEAVTHRMLALDSLWELSVALKSSRIVERVPENLEDDEAPDEPKKVINK